MLNPNDFVICIDGDKDKESVHTGEIYEVLQTKFFGQKIIIQLKGQLYSGLWYSATRFNKVPSELANLLYGKK